DLGHNAPLLGNGFDHASEQDRLSDHDRCQYDIGDANGRDLPLVGSEITQGSAIDLQKCHAKNLVSCCIAASAADATPWHIWRQCEKRDSVASSPTTTATRLYVS